MNKTVTVQVNAKINLSLYVVGKAERYHMLNSVVASVDIADVISARTAEKDEMIFSDKTIDCEKSNAYAALKYMRSKYSLPCVSVSVRNEIPCGAGLGGSSADCAGVILAVNKLFSLDLTLNEMREAANNFGSDTAYMLTGGFAVLQGRGEVIDRFESAFSPSVFIAYKGSVGTKECFSLFDRRNDGESVKNSEKLVSALQNGDESAVTELLENDLTSCAAALNEGITRIFELAGRRKCVMTGSGAGVVIFGGDEELAKNLEKEGITVIKTHVLPSSRR